MALESEFVIVPLASFHDECKKLIDGGWRFIQTHCVNVEDKGIDIIYSFMQGNLIRNLKIEGVQKTDKVESITDLTLAAFVFENEARELFGIDMQNIAIDFGGNFYKLAEKEPMCFISPKIKEEKEKAKKVALAMEARKRKAAEEAAAKAAEAPAKEGE